MLPTIQELENEIEQFHKNIKDSDELMNILISVTALTKSQTESFESNTASLHDELKQLPPQIGEFIQKGIDKFVVELNKEHQAYQDSVSAIMKQYSDKMSLTEETMAKIPEALSEQLQQAREQSTEDLKQIQSEYAASLAKANEDYSGYLQTALDTIQKYSDKMSLTEEAMAKIPEALSEQLQQAREQSTKDLKQIQSEYAASLAKANEEHSRSLQAAIEIIRAILGQIKDDSEKQYGAFLKEFEKMMDARLAQLSDTETRVLDLSKQLEEKYASFVAKLEATNVDQLYKYCQSMNKAINTKLGIVLGGVAIAVIIAVVSLFI